MLFEACLYSMTSLVAVARGFASIMVLTFHIFPFSRFLAATVRTIPTTPLFLATNPKASIFSLANCLSYCKMIEYT